jgi:hypothetical protein
MPGALTNTTPAWVNTRWLELHLAGEMTYAVEAEPESQTDRRHAA